MAAKDPAGQTTVHAGFLPLVDCAPLVIAKEKAFDREFDVELRLHKEASWANIRDKVDAGLLDCAHMLAPMPLAATLGLGRASEPVIAPMALSLNGNAITVSLPLFDEMRDLDETALRQGGLSAARPLKAIISARQAEGREPLTFGMVYPFSCHNYDLRCWLASAGIDPDNDLNIVVVPPPLIAASLKAGRIDGLCVGAPWNSVAVTEGFGAIVATKGELWPRSPEKVLGVREDWAAANASLLSRLIGALTQAAQWLALPENRIEAARILSAPHYIGLDTGILLQPLTGHMEFRPGLKRHVPDMMLFGAGTPWPEHAIWLLSQMIRWGQAREPFDLMAVARRVYRPDLYRQAIGKLATGLPLADERPASPPAAFAGAVFDPQLPLDYLAEVTIKSPATDLRPFETLTA